MSMVEKRREALANQNSDGVIQRLRDVLQNNSIIHEPWTSDVVTLPESETTFFYEMALQRRRTVDVQPAYGLSS